MTLDLTNKKIKDTYQRLLQIDTGSGGLVCDGIGSSISDIKFQSATTIGSSSATPIQLTGSVTVSGSLLVDGGTY